MCVSYDTEISVLVYVWRSTCTNQCNDIYRETYLSIFYGNRKHGILGIHHQGIGQENVGDMDHKAELRCSEPHVQIATKMAEKQGIAQGRKLIKVTTHTCGCVCTHR